MRSRAVLLVALAVAGAPGESPVASATDSAAVELGFAGYSTSPAVGLGGPAAAGSLQIDKAYLSLRDVRFRPAAACDQASRAAVIGGPIVAELVGRRASGAGGEHALPRTRYCRVELRPRAASGAGIPALEGRTVVVQGWRADGVPFVVRSARRELIALVARGAGGFALPDGRARLLVGADLGRWMEGIDLAGLLPERGKNGVIRIDEGSHRDLLRRFEANLRAGIALCRDLDDDGAVSPRECGPDHRLAASR